METRAGRKFTTEEKTTILTESLLALLKLDPFLQELMGRKISNQPGTDREANKIAEALLKSTGDWDCVSQLDQNRVGFGSKTPGNFAYPINHQEPSGLAELLNNCFFVSPENYDAIKELIRDDRLRKSLMSFIKRLDVNIFVGDNGSIDVDKTLKWLLQAYSINFPPDVTLDIASSSLIEILDGFEKECRNAQIEGPLFPTKQAKEEGRRVPFRIAEKTLDFKLSYQEYSRRVIAKELILDCAFELFQEAEDKQENSSPLARMVNFCLRWKLPDHYPVPNPSFSGSTLKRNAARLYRSDAVLSSDGKVIIVEDDASPGGLAISEIMLDLQGKSGPLTVLAQELRKEDIGNITILRSGTVFPRPEHLLIKSILKKHGINVEIINIEDLEETKQIPDGYVFFYGLPVHLFPTETSIEYELLMNPRKLIKLMAQNNRNGESLTPKEIKQLEERLQTMQDSLIKQFKNYLTSFSQLAIQYMVQVYTELFPLFDYEKFKQIAKEETTRRIKIANELIEEENNGRIRFVNPLSSFRLTLTKTGDAIPFLPGFREYVTKRALEKGVDPNIIDTFYQTTPETFLFIPTLTGIPELDFFMQQCIETIRENPGNFVIKGADCPLGLTSWGSRSFIPHPSHETLEKLTASDMPWIIQRKIPPFFPHDVPYFVTDKIVAVLQPTKIIPRISPYCILGVPSNGIYTIERRGGGPDDISAHGGTSSIIGPLIICN
ncbi:MAG: hypothetical protein N2593_00435 [Patescibacteria group bacterium]|nr:hypothetical protein [Patescibacteria group bacterium]